MPINNDEKIKVIYISGMGRSGSTLIDLILSTSNKIFSVGEIYKHKQLKNDNFICACGDKFNDCKFWGNFNLNKNYFNIINRVNYRDYLNIINYLYNPFNSKISLNKKSDNYGILKKVTELIPKETEYILDSSKELGRLIELTNDSRFDVYNINIVRDGRAVANSFNSKTQSHGKNYFASLFKWILMNTLIFKYIKRSKVNSLNISYDSFCLESEKYIKKLNKFLNINISNNYIEIARNMDYHCMGGNRLSHKENRAKIAGITIDEKWKTQRNKFTRIMSTGISYFFNKKWVYTKKINI